MEIAFAKGTAPVVNLQDDARFYAVHSTGPDGSVGELLGQVVGTADTPVWSIAREAMDLVARLHPGEDEAVIVPYASLHGVLMGVTRGVLVMLVRRKIAGEMEVEPRVQDLVAGSTLRLGKL